MKGTQYIAGGTNGDKASLCAAPNKSPAKYFKTRKIK